MKALSLSFSLVTFLGLSACGAFAKGAPHGSVLELHSCELYAGGCTVSAEATQDGKYMLRMWDFAGGDFDGTPFKGLNVAVLQASPDNLAAKDSRTGDAVIYLPQAASQRQRDALLAWVKNSQPDFRPEKLHIRMEPLRLEKTGSQCTVAVGNIISVQTKPLEQCDSRSCGEELWYEPRAATSIFTVALNHASRVDEPLLKLTWKDSMQRSVFLGRFGEHESNRKVFVTLNELCGTNGIF